MDRKHQTPLLHLRSIARESNVNEIYKCFCPCCGVTLLMIHFLPKSTAAAVGGLEEASSKHMRRSNAQSTLNRSSARVFASTPTRTDKRQTNQPTEKGKKIAKMKRQGVLHGGGQTS
ncbi:unnamed protein product [Ectocarpus sp. 12 AP-2014]